MFVVQRGINVDGVAADSGDCPLLVLSLVVPQTSRGNGNLIADPPVGDVSLQGQPSCRLTFEFGGL